MKDKIRPCPSLNSYVPPISSDFPPISSNPPPISSNNSKSIIDNKEVSINDLILKKINDIVNPNLDNLDTNTCLYCKSVFTRFDNLQRHQRIRCKSKKNYDELDRRISSFFDLN